MKQPRWCERGNAWHRRGNGVWGASLPSPPTPTPHTSCSLLLQDDQDIKLLRMVPADPGRGVWRWELDRQTDGEIHAQKLGVRRVKDAFGSSLKCWTRKWVKCAEGKKTSFFFSLACLRKMLVHWVEETLGGEFVRIFCSWDRSRAWYKKWGCCRRLRNRLCESKLCRHSE